jgi:hypothetical protein
VADRVGDDPVAAALAVIQAENPQLARAADAGIEALTWGEGLAVITHRGLADFLWYELPTKWVCELSEQVAIATALARLFELLDMPRYAALCAAPATAEILSTYEREGRSAGLTAYRRAVDASGVEPPDVPDLLRWGAVMGTEEAAAYGSVATTLEMAAAAGQFTPGARGWRGAAQQLVGAHLTEPRPELQGQCWRDVIHAERMAHWVRSRNAARGSLATAIVGQLAGTIPAPATEDAEAALAPVRWLLGKATADGGVPLTQNHTLNRAVLTEACLRFDWLTTTGRPRSELDLPEAWALRSFVHELGLVRRSGRSLLLTLAGRRLVDADTGSLWNAVAPALIPRDPAEAAAAEIGLMLLVQQQASDQSGDRRRDGRRGLAQLTIRPADRLRCRRLDGRWPAPPVGAPRLASGTPWHGR